MSYCPICGALPPQECNPRTHEVERRLWEEDPVWVMDNGTGKIIPSRQRRQEMETPPGVEPG